MLTLFCKLGCMQHSVITLKHNITLGAEHLLCYVKLRPVDGLLGKTFILFTRPGKL